jgi:hypothetical protein
LEILQKQKNDLQAKSNELSGTIENRVVYLQKNFVPLIRDSLVESAISKLPPQLQNLAGSFIQKEQKTNTQITQNSTHSKLVLGIVAGIAGIVPLFLRGKKVKFLSIIVNQIIRFIA